MLGSKRTATENFVARKKWPTKKFRTLARDGKDLLVTHYYAGKL